MNTTWKPAGYPSISPYLTCRNAEALIAFLQEAKYLRPQQFVTELREMNTGRTGRL